MTDACYKERQTNRKHPLACSVKEIVLWRHSMIICRQPRSVERGYWKQSECLGAACFATVTSQLIAGVQGAGIESRWTELPSVVCPLAPHRYLRRESINGSAVGCKHFKFLCSLGGGWKGNRLYWMLCIANFKYLHTIDNPTRSRIFCILLGRLNHVEHVGRQRKWEIRK